MTATLPQEVRDAFERFITCEYTTVDARQQPIVWPVTPFYSSGAPTLDTTTGLGYPKKANDARRNPQVAFLFSDPTGSGIQSGIQVLVQGMAEVDDRDLEANLERYEREAVVKLPRGRSVLLPRIVRGMFGWYVNRIYIKVRPERVFVWPDGDLAKQPECHGTHIEEVRSGHSRGAARGRASHPRAVPSPGTRGSSSSVAATRPRCSPGWHRTASRSPRASRSASTPTRAGSPSEPSLRACRWPRDAPASPPTPTIPTSAGGRTSRSGATWFGAGRGWALVPHKLVGGLELPEQGDPGPLPGHPGQVDPLQRTARRELRKRKA